LAQDRAKQGRIAGEILYLAIESTRADGTKPDLTEIKQLLAQAYTGKNATNTSAVNTIWKTFRPVSHLWAAHLQYRHQGRGRYFPCHVSEISDLLWASERYRRLGETTKLRKNAPVTVLPGDECVRVPDEMKFSKKDWNTH
jgi:hypothetical protein